MANHLSRYFLFMACLLVGLVGLAGTAPSEAVPLREQYLAADNMPTVARGARGKITFTATQSPTSIVKEVTFDAPDGVIIVGIGPGRTGKMPACRLGNALPSNRATCVAESGQGRFSIRPSESLAIEFAVDGAASIGALSGLVRLEQQDSGSHDRLFGINVQPTPELNNEVHCSKRQIDPVIAGHHGGPGLAEQCIPGLARALDHARRHRPVAVPVLHALGVRSRCRGPGLEPVLGSRLILSLIVDVQKRDGAHPQGR